jgi:2-keto-4-pentenoate hydratase/2-oxohepta-3-ene-1,7-dioic acid hydratase in catechol pathway
MVLRMRYLTFSLPDDATERIGVTRGDTVVDVNRLLHDPRTLPELIDQGPDTWRRFAELVADAIAKDPPDSALHSANAIRWHAPIRRPRKNVFCMGRNYLSHVKEAAQARGTEAKIPDAPVFFTKAPTTVTGPFDPIPWDRQVTEQVDYEAELGAIVGVAGRNIPRARSLAHVFGYTIINDVSARDLQVRHLQWFKGKSLDGFCPMGPVVVTADEFGDPQQKRIALRVNGVEKQSSTTANMIFPIDVIIEALSRGMTIEPGDVIATGTPEGVGLGRTPPEYLKDGDEVETEIEGIGVLRNRVVALPTPEPESLRSRVRAESELGVGPRRAG